MNALLKTTPTKCVMATSTSTVCTVLSGEVLEKARRELREEPERREECIAELKRRIEEKEAAGDPELDGVVFQRKDGPFLLRFLRARKFDIERALALYVKYYHNRVVYSGVFEEFTPQSCANVLRSGVLRVLEHRMRDGAKVIVASPGMWDMDTTPPHIFIRSMLLVLERLLEDEETQVHGFALFQMYEDFTFMKVIQFTQTDLVKNGTGLKIMQDGFPARFKGFHMIEPPWYISTVLTLVKPFMKEKLRQRIHMHSGDWTTLHDLISPEHLPHELGGTLPSLQSFTADKLFSEEELTCSPSRPVSIPVESAPPPTE